MPNIPNSEQQVPMMYRAQINGRCQVQRLIPKADEQDAEKWADQWTERTYPTAPTFDDKVQQRTYQVSWRFVTNGGQDDGVIRPVIGAKGWPFYPGSSMKGLFRQACKPDQATYYCGDESTQSPGILRFHGGYPTNTDWTDNLVDLIHPQQNRQVIKESRSSAFTQISLYRPELAFGISSTQKLSEEQWQDIWTLWEKALAQGIGCRVSSGYGQFENIRPSPENLLYYTQLKGQGQAAKLLDEVGEFRPNIFRAGIRGHAMRIFSGLTDGNTAEQLVEALFGGISRSGATVGWLNMTFDASDLTLDTFGQRSYEQPTYEVQGTLSWFLAKPIPDSQRATLVNLIEYLTRFAVTFGGFGKSWRRADHRLVYPDYYDVGSKPLIGCHWQWSGPRSLTRDNRVRQLEHISHFIDQVQQAAKDWMQLQGIPPKPSRRATWRETWHPDNVQVWGRIAEDIEDSEAVHWFHGPYQRADRTLRLPERSIKQTSVTGKLGNIGRVWHRMYPWMRAIKDPDNPKRPKIIRTGKYFELLTLFPDQSRDCQNFVDYLDSQYSVFKPLWP